MDVFEIVVPYLSTTNKKTMLTTKVYATTREEVSFFICQHNIKVYDVNVLNPESFCKDFSESDLIDKYLFKSNHDNTDYRIYTTENIIRDAIDYLGEKLAGLSMFGNAILRTDIPIIDIINLLIEKLKHVAILDYLVMDETNLEILGMDKVKEHVRTFSNKAFELLPDSPSESDALYDYIYESLHNSSYCKGSKPEAITIEGYVEYIASWLTDRVEE